mgnify:CR=1 FL=1
MDRIPDHLIAEVAIGKTRLAAMEFVGTMFVTANWDDDWIGSVFSFQVNSISLHSNLFKYVSYVSVNNVLVAGYLKLLSLHELESQK